MALMFDINKFREWMTKENRLRDLLVIEFEEDWIHKYHGKRPTEILLNKKDLVKVHKYPHLFDDVDNLMGFPVYNDLAEIEDFIIIRKEWIGDTDG